MAAAVAAGSNAQDPPPSGPRGVGEGRRAHAAKARPRTSPPEPFLIMPLQVFSARPMLGALGNPQLRPTEVVVVLPVVEVRVDVVAYLELVVRCDCHVAGIEQLMDIGAQQQPVPDIVLWLFLEGPDVSRLERRKRLLACYSALPPVHVGNDGPEDPLPDSVLHGHRIAVAAGKVEPATRLGLRDDGSAQTIEYLRP